MPIAAAIPAIAGVVSAGSSIAGAAMSSGGASAANERSADLGNKQLNFSFLQWKTFMDSLKPLKEELKKPMEEQQGFGRMMGTIDRGYSDATGNLRRTMGGRYPYGAPLEGIALQNLELDRTRTKAGATADWANNNWDRMMGVASLTGGLPAAATAGLSDASRTAAYQANQANQAAAGAWGNVGQTYGNLGQMAMMMGSPGANTASIPGAAVPAAAQPQYAPPINQNIPMYLNA